MSCTNNKLFISDPGPLRLDMTPWSRPLARRGTGFSGVHTKIQRSSASTTAPTKKKKKLASQGCRRSSHASMADSLGLGHPALHWGAGLAQRNGRIGEICKFGLGLHTCVFWSELKLPVGWSEAADDLGCGSHGPKCRVRFSIPAPRIHFFMRPVVDITRTGHIPLFCTLALLGLGSDSQLGKLGGGGRKGRGGGQNWQAIHHHRLALGRNTFLRTFTNTIWIGFFTLFFRSCFIFLVDISRGCQHETSRGLMVKPHEIGRDFSFILLLLRLVLFLLQILVISLFNKYPTKNKSISPWAAFGI